MSAITLDTVKFRYRNHKGEEEERHVRPIEIYFGSTAWHPEPQWMMRVWDIQRGGTRDYAIAGILSPPTKVYPEDVKNFGDKT